MDEACSERRDPIRSVRERTLLALECENLFPGLESLMHLPSLPLSVSQSNADWVGYLRVKNDVFTIWDLLATIEKLRADFDAKVRAQTS